MYVCVCVCVCVVKSVRPVVKYNLFTSSYLYIY